MDFSITYQLFPTTFFKKDYNKMEEWLELPRKMI